MEAPTFNDLLAAGSFASEEQVEQMTKYISDCDFCALGTELITLYEEMQKHDQREMQISKGKAFAQELADAIQKPIIEATT